MPCSTLVAANPDLGVQVTLWSCVLSAASCVLYTLKHLRYKDTPLLIFTLCNSAQVAGPLNRSSLIILTRLPLTIMKA